MPSQCAEQAAEEAAVAAAAAASAAAASAEVAGDVATASTSTSRFAEISISNAPVHDNGNTTEIATGIGNASFSSTLPSLFSSANLPVKNKMLGVALVDNKTQIAFFSFFVCLKIV